MTAAVQRIDYLADGSAYIIDGVAEDKHTIEFVRDGSKAYCMIDGAKVLAHPDHCVVNADGTVTMTIHFKKLILSDATN